MTYQERTSPRRGLPRSVLFPIAILALCACEEPLPASHAAPGTLVTPEDELSLESRLERETRGLGERLGVALTTVRTRQLELGEGVEVEEMVTTDAERCSFVFVVAGPGIRQLQTTRAREGEASVPEARWDSWGDMGIALHELCFRGEAGDDWRDSLLVRAGRGDGRALLAVLSSPIPARSPD